mmetsp:Transcript_58998/g.93879  ORF Transcript_58998/g.93879 Transcript_58998/m.93879 type:complete len:377 (+) Transcript_58998:158-1288(+)
MYKYRNTYIDNRNRQKYRRNGTGTFFLFVCLRDLYIYTIDILLECFLCLISGIVSFCFSVCFSFANNFTTYYLYYISFYLIITLWFFCGQVTRNHIMASCLHNFATSLILLLLSCHLHVNARTCEYTDSASGRKLYLDALADATMTHTGSASNPLDRYTYTFTPCRNAAGECDSSGGGVDTAMCRQTLDEDTSLCMVIANYDASIQPTFSSTGNGTWNFIFQNGDSTGCPSQQNRELSLTLYCREQFDYLVHDAGEVPNQDCKYEFQIYTKWACAGQYYDPEDGSSSLSAGSIFLIILLAGLFAYFCFGWIVCFFMNRKDRGFDVVGNIPHVTFWTKLPALTIAGCCFTKDFCLGLCSKGTSAEDGSAAAYESVDQ